MNTKKEVFNIMLISHKAAYHLLGRFYVRRSLKELIKKDIPPNTFESAKVFAYANEDYHFLEVMVENIDDYDKNWAIFYDQSGKPPYILQNKKGLTLVDFALLCCGCDEVHEQEFIDVVEAQASGMEFADELNTKKMIKQFKGYLKIFAPVEE